MVYDSFSSLEEYESVVEFNSLSQFTEYDINPDDIEPLSEIDDKDDLSFLPNGNFVDYETALSLTPDAKIIGVIKEVLKTRKEANK